MCALQARKSLGKISSQESFVYVYIHIYSLYMKKKKNRLDLIHIVNRVRPINDPDLWSEVNEFFLINPKKAQQDNLVNKLFSVVWEWVASKSNKKKKKCRERKERGRSGRWHIFLPRCLMFLCMLQCVYISFSFLFGALFLRGWTVYFQYSG